MGCAGLAGAIPCLAAGIAPRREFFVLFCVCQSSGACCRLKGNITGIPKKFTVERSNLRAVERRYHLFLVGVIGRGFS